MTHVLQDWVDYLGYRGLPLFAMNGIVHTPPWDNPDGLSSLLCSCWRAGGCDRPGKHPLHADWQTEQLDLTKTPAWANLGVRTGHGLIVIDIDDPELAKLSDYPTTFTVATAAGFHLYFTHTSAKAFRTMVKWRPGTDVRAEGGLVVAPPSLHISGVRYMPSNHAEIAPLPDELYHQIPAQAPKTTPSIRSDDWEPAETDAPNYGGMAEMLLEEMTYARPGERNHVLFRLASRLTELIDAGMLRPIWLVELARAANDAGLGWSEINRTIASASNGLTEGSGARNTSRTRVLSSPKDGG